MKKFIVILLALSFIGCSLNRRETEDVYAISNEVFTKRSIAQDYITTQKILAHKEAQTVMANNYSQMWTKEYQNQPIVKETIAATMVVPIAAVSAVAYGIQTLQIPVFFELDSYVLSSVARQQMQDKADILNSNDRVVLTIVGRASGKGSIAYNTKLSKLRAEMCKQYLIAQNINPNRLLLTYRGNSDAIKEGLHEDQRTDFSVTIVKKGAGINPPPEGPGLPVEPPTTPPDCTPKPCIPEAELPSIQPVPVPAAPTSKG